MINFIKARTPIIAIVLSILAVGYTFAANRVVVVPLEVDAAPSGMVSAFNSSTCPNGWQHYSAAEGRFLLGSIIAGNTGGSVSHTHRWARINGSKTWSSYANVGAVKPMLSYGDGIGNEGGGHYPIAPASGSVASFFTQHSGVYPPFTYVRFCEKV